MLTIPYPDSIVKAMLLCLLAFEVLLSSVGAFGATQVADRANPEVIESPHPQQSGGDSRSAPIAQAQASPVRKTKKHFPGRGAIIAAPLPIVSPALGTGVVPILGYIFPISKNDKVSPPSVIGAGGLITNDGSRGFGLYADLYYKEDRYETTGLYGHGNLDYNLYGIGTASGDAGLKLPLDQTGQVFRAEFLRVITWKIFAGGVDGPLNLLTNPHWHICQYPGRRHARYSNKPGLCARAFVRQRWADENRARSILR